MFEIVGYSSQWSVAPGQDISVMVSCDGVDSYCADLVRIHCGDTSPGAPGLKETTLARNIVGPIKGRKQYTEVGSFAKIELDREVEGRSFSWLMGIMATTPQKGERQFVFGRWNEAQRRGYGLFIDEAGYLEWMAGDAEGVRSVRASRALVCRQWYRVGVHINVENGVMTLRQDPVAPLHALNSASSAQGQWPGLDVDAVGVGVLSLGACPSGNATPRMTQHFNGRIDSLILLRGAFDDEALEQLARAPDLRQFVSPPLIEFDFSQDLSSDRIHDRAGFGLSGRLFNLPTRAVTGILWDGSAMDWTRKPEHYAAIHFHDDALEDAEWEADFSFMLPRDLKSGLYAIKLYSGDTEHRIPLFVRPGFDQPKAKIAFLASTTTFLAYSNSHYRLDEAGMEMKSGMFAVVNPWDAYLGEHRELGLSVYDTHSDGYGVFYSSRRRPIFSVNLQCRTWTLNGDAHFIDWLDKLGFDYDLITDEMLHEDGPEALAPYKVIMTGAHPEYWTTAMWDTMVAYQSAGGRLMYMGGNGFYWRCSYDREKPWVMELRRNESGARYWETMPGEGYHSTTGEYGGLWRRLGRAPQGLVGVGTVATGFDASSYYRRTDASHDERAAFIFEGVDDEIIGDFGSLGGGAAGDEIDRADFSLGTPRHALVVARSEGHTRYYNVVPEETLYHHPAINGEESDSCYADLVFYECLRGGAVFATGSITWGASLSWNGYDNNVSRITANVLKRFSSDEPFSFPSTE